MVAFHTPCEAYQKRSLLLAAYRPLKVSYMQDWSYTEKMKRIRVSNAVSICPNGIETVLIVADFADVHMVCENFAPLSSYIDTLRS